MIVSFSTNMIRPVCDTVWQDWNGSNLCLWEVCDLCFLCKVLVARLELRTICIISFGRHTSHRKIGFSDLFPLKNLPQNSPVYIEIPVNTAHLSPFKKFHSPIIQILNPPEPSPKTSLFIKFPLKIFHCLESSCTPVLAQMRNHLEAQVSQ